MIFTPKAADMRDVVAQYQKMPHSVSIALFSKKVDGKLVHDLDIELGKKPYKYISFSKKHFTEVTIPKYCYR